jgi:hypothetical protein
MVGGEMIECAWHRALCSKCGLLNFALAEPHPNERRGHCPLCGASCRLRFKGLGRCLHPLPFVEPVRFRFRPRACPVKMDLAEL